jgi:multidrug efflux pump
MKFTDLFIRRPVLAVVISLLILVLGLRSLFSLPVNQYPKPQNAVVTISTTYYGADAATVAGFITQPLEAAIAQAQGIDYLSSSSASGVSTITATLRLNYDANRALTEINTQVNSVKNQLPPQAQQPVLTVATGPDHRRDVHGLLQRHAADQQRHRLPVRVVKPKLDSDARRADRRAARRAPVRAARLAGRRQDGGARADGADVSTALGNNNYLAALGAPRARWSPVTLTAGTDLHSVDEFKQLIVKQNGDSIVRLEDVATVTLGFRELRLQRRVQRRALGVHRHQGGAGGQHPRRRQARARGLPRPAVAAAHGVTGEIVYDSTDFINTSISEVVKTLVEALLIVTVVIFLFLGSSAR